MRNIGWSSTLTHTRSLNLHIDTPTLVRCQIYFLKNDGGILFGSFSALPNVIRVQFRIET